MPYSKLINIETKLVNTSYNFQFSRPFIFRFLTNDNIDGIEFNEEKILKVNNSDVGNNNWYKYNSNINFSPLNKYKYLILQLYSDEYVNEAFTLSNNINENFVITNSNSWYKCIIPGSDCGIRIFDQRVLSDKPIQEVTNSLIYEIDGDAFTIKNKYLKAGSSDSIIKISGMEPNTINYIGKFELKAINNKPEKTKNPVSINKYSEFIDEKIFKNTKENCNELKNIDNRIDMIKFQLKNYFIENDKQLVVLEKDIKKNAKVSSLNIDRINQNVIDLSSQSLKIDNNTLEIETIGKSVNNLSDDLKKKVDEIEEQIKNSELGAKNLSINEHKLQIDERIEKLKEYIKFDYDKLKMNIDDNTIKISENNSSINNRLKDIEELNKITELRFNEADKKFSELKNLNVNNSLKFEEIRQLTEILENKINGKLIENNSYVWSNNSQQLYEINYHSSLLNLNFDTESLQYTKNGLYLLIDITNITIPYYCTLIKELDNTTSTARLIPLATINRFG